MTFILTHSVAWALAGFAVWWLWRRASAGPDPTVAQIVTLGLLARAVGGVALFWISWLRLPIAVSLQTDPGFWFFAPDASIYFDSAELASMRGLGSVLLINRYLPSAVYTQALAAVIYLTGGSPAAAVLLNVLAYLASCILLITWSRRLNLGRWTLLIALCSVSFFPSWILWSFQALKDTVFLTLMLAYKFAVSRWLDRPVTEPHFLRRSLVGVAVVVLLLHPIASIRWYVAGLMAGSTVLAWVPVLVRSPQRRLARAGLVFLFVALVSLLLPLSAGPYLPRFAQQFFRPATSSGLAAFPAGAVDYLEEKRGDSLATGAQTLIDSPGADTGAVEQSLMERMFPRVVAMFLPRAVGTALGWVTIGGGRGLWALAEIDTVFMDLLIVAMAWRVWHERRRGLVVRPVFIVTAITTVALTIAICYQTANFGTQFRFRSMVALGFILMPFALGRDPEKDPACAG